MNKHDSLDYVVCVECMTFNQSAYIRQTMDGFSIQNTNFPYVCIIVDDASTDCEQQVIQQYLHENFEKRNLNPEDTDDYSQVFLHHKTNSNCYFCVLFLKYNHYLKKYKDPYIAKWEHKSKYVAFCEGDDYWTDSLKLEKQVNFLDNNLDYSMCFTDVATYIQDKGIMGPKRSSIFKEANLKIDSKGKGSVFYDILLNKCSIETLGIMVRSSLYSKRERDPVGFMMGDTQLLLYMSQCGKIKYIDDCTGVYRVNQTYRKQTGKKLLFNFSMYEMRIFYCKKYGYGIPNIIRKRYNRTLANLIFHDIKIGREPLFPLFKMNYIQSFLFCYTKKHRNFFKLIEFVWLFEKVIYKLIELNKKRFFS